VKPLAIDLFCGLGGWTEGLLAGGYNVIGFDIERHQYGDEKYPAQLVLQDVLTIHGRQFKDADLIVASPPCQEFSYMAMPWSLAKEKAKKIAADPAERKRLTALFDACFRIQREAIEASGRYIPMVVENVCGAQKWVGRAKWHFGSFYLWGDVPVLMPITLRGLKGIPHSPGGHWTNPAENGEKVPGFRFDGSGKSFQSAAVEGVKQSGIGGTRDNGMGDGWFQDGAARHGSKSPARKRASAMIAKIPLSLSRHIARTYRTSWIAVGLDRAVYGGAE
jgi:hypothetical protein